MSATQNHSAYVDTRPFWDGAKARRLVLQRCRDTGRFQHVPRPISIYTGSRNLEWGEVCGLGEVTAATILRTGRSRIDGSTPHVIAAVRLVEGVIFLSELVGPDKLELAVGTRVHVVFSALQDGRMWPAFGTVGA